MFSSSRGLSALLGLAISVITTIAVSIILHLSGSTILLVFLLTLVISSLCAYGILEFLIFREISKLHSVLSKLFEGNVSADEVDQESLKLPILNFMQSDVASFVEKKQEEVDRLKKLETFRKEFIGNVSHELKTPIFAAQGFLHTLLDGAVNDRAVRMKFLRKAAKSLDGLDALVQDLLVLSQIETGQIKMHFEDTDLYKLTEEVFEQFEDKINKKGIELRIDGNYGSVMVYGDAVRLTQVMTNLVSNAIRHSFEDGEVIVTFEQTRRHVTVSVRDFGEGISEEHQSRIFERFYRVDKSRARDKGKGGTGLGLAIVKHILEGHNTRAEVDSRPGHGSVFSFKLPRFKPEPEN
jgi:two-component system, OmpR family, phosphate regulon sensor histidine kinase PhoR